MFFPGLIILAAGGSTRMGRVKQLLPIAGTTLLRRAVETALATTFRPIVVVLGCEAEACRAEIASLPVEVAINSDWAEGLGTSLRVGVETLERIAPEISGAMVLLPDQPTVTAAWLEELRARWHPPEAPLVATNHEGHGGVPALLGREFFPELLALSGDGGARVVLANNRARAILLRPPQPVTDLDTPEDLRRFEAHS